MSRTHVISKHPWPTFLLFCALLTCWPTSAVSAEEGCREALPLALDATTRHLSDSGSPQCFTSYVPGEGIWMLEVSAPGSITAEPRLTVLGRACGDLQTKASRLSYREELAQSVLLEISDPGDYTFCVGAQDPGDDLGAYKITSGFAAGFATKDGDPKESNPDPDPIVATGLTTKDGDPKESNPDPDPVLYAPAPSGTAIHEVCGASRTDDHADTLRCATAVDPEHGMEAKIENSWNDDEDVFTFVVRKLRTVRLEGEGDIDLAATLFDRRGHRLMTHGDGGPGNGLRIVKTLAPGRYFLRVGSRDGASGGYRLSLELLDR